MRPFVTSRAIPLLLVSLMAWGQQWTDPKAHQLSQAEVKNWLATGFAGKTPLRFFSSQGKRVCCDMPNTELEFMTGNRIHVLIDGFAQSVYTLPFAVQADGKIAVTAENERMAEWVPGKPYASTFLYRYGEELYLVPASVGETQFPVPRRTFWPLVFISKGEWR